MVFWDCNLDSDVYSIFYIRKFIQSLIIFNTFVFFIVFCNFSMYSNFFFKFCYLEVSFILFIDWMFAFATRCYFFSFWSNDEAWIDLLLYAVFNISFCKYVKNNWWSVSIYMNISFSSESIAHLSSYKNNINKTGKSKCFETIYITI